jgi:hypothetical protein
LPIHGARPPVGQPKLDWGLLDKIIVSRFWGRGDDNRMLLAIHKALKPQAAFLQYLNRIYAVDQSFSPDATKKRKAEAAKCVSV